MRAPLNAQQKKAAALQTFRNYCTRAGATPDEQNSVLAVGAPPRMALPDADVEANLYTRLRQLSTAHASQNGQSEVNTYVNDLLQHAPVGSTAKDVAAGLQEVYYDHVAALPPHIDLDNPQAVALRLEYLKGLPQTPANIALYNQFHERLAAHSWQKFMATAKAENRADAVEEKATTSFNAYIDQRIIALNQVLATRNPNTRPTWAGATANLLKNSIAAKMHRLMAQGIQQSANQVDGELKATYNRTTQQLAQTVKHCEALGGNNIDVKGWKDDQKTALDQKIAAFATKKTAIENGEEFKNEPNRAQALAAANRGLERQELVDQKAKNEGIIQNLQQLQTAHNKKLSAFRPGMPGERNPAEETLEAFRGLHTAMGAVALAALVVPLSKDRGIQLVNHFAQAGGRADHLALNMSKVDAEIARLQLENAALQAKINALPNDPLPAGNALAKAKEWRHWDKEQKAAQTQIAAMAAAGPKLARIQAATADCKNQLTALQNAAEQPGADLKAIGDQTLAARQNLNTALRAEIQPSEFQTVLDCARGDIADRNHPNQTIKDLSSAAQLDEINMAEFALPVTAASTRQEFEKINADHIVEINKLLKKLEELDILRQATTDPTQVAALQTQQEEIRKQIAEKIKVLNQILARYAGDYYLSSFSKIGALGKKVQALNKSLNGEADKVPTHNANAAGQGTQARFTEYWEKNRETGKMEKKFLLDDKGNPMILKEADIMAVISELNNTTFKNSPNKLFATKEGDTLVVECHSSGNLNTYIEALKKKNAELVNKPPEDAKANDDNEAAVNVPRM